MYKRQVVVKTWWNAEKGKYNKRPVNCNSDKGEYAESDNPETWTTFDNALKLSLIHIYSMTEMYTMQTYLQKRTLEKLGIDYFDAWAAD